MTNNRSNTEIDTFAPPAPAVVTPDRVGQATAIEQARAVAEVQAAIVVAQQCPRSTAEALRQMRESCGQMGLAERAFFRYSRGGGQVTGPSVHLARELARCWGNLQYGITELSRDDVKGESQMLAFAWDVQTNTRATTTFIVKHGRDTKNGRTVLTELRDIYENNANNGARRLREQIFAILPKWFTEEGQTICRTTIEKGAGDKPLAQRVADIIRAFEGLGVAADQLERKVGRARDKWTAHDVATLSVIGRSIKNGETTVGDEFPDDKVTLDDITGGQPPTTEQPKANGRSRAASPAAEPAATEPEPTDEDIAAMNAEAAAAAAEHAAAPSGMFGSE